MRWVRAALWAAVWILAVALLIAVITDPEPGGPKPRYNHCVSTRPGVLICS